MFLRAYKNVFLRMDKNIHDSSACRSTLPKYPNIQTKKMKTSPNTSTTDNYIPDL